MPKFMIDLASLALDETGRVVLSGEQLDAIERDRVLTFAGGPVNYNCPETTNSGCSNVNCAGSQNAGCNNTLACTDTSNVRCAIPPQVPEG